MEKNKYGQRRISHDKMILMNFKRSFEVYSPEDLRAFCEECFIKAGVSEEHAKLIADHLITASLRGVDSHGIIRISYYLEGIRRGYVKPKAEIRILKETPNCALIDGGMLLGIIVAKKAMEIAIQKAKKSDMALVGARNLGHVGMLAYYTRKMAEQRLIGLACANAPAKVAPWGGAEEVFGTNPISIGIPVDNGPPIVMDMATSATASFKIRIALRQGKKLPPNVLLDKHGRPTTEPKDYMEGGVLLPFGGHKGYALMLVIEILASAFIGGPISKEVIDHASTQGGLLVAAIKPTLFRDYEEYTRDLKRIIHEIKNCKTREGFSEVLLPGEPEERVYEERRRSGIPIDPEVLRLLKEVAKRLDIPFPKKIS